MSSRPPLSDDALRELAAELAGDDKPPFFRDLKEVVEEVQAHRAAVREDEERLHRLREEAAGRPIAKLAYTPTSSYLVNPEPEVTEGLEVYFDDAGNCGLYPVAFRDSRFVLSPAAALQLADLILAHQPGDEFALAVKLNMRVGEAPPDPTAAGEGGAA